MRMVLAVLLVTMVAAGASAQQSGLGSAIERQQRDLATQQAEMRREIDRQGATLQQQQERNLQFQLLQRQQPVVAPPPVRCIAPAGALVCQ
jgi:hypothetical protein